MYSYEEISIESRCHLKALGTLYRLFLYTAVDKQDVSIVRGNSWNLRLIRFSCKAFSAGLANWSLQYCRPTRDNSLYNIDLGDSVELCGYVSSAYNRTVLYSFSAANPSPYPRCPFPALTLTPSLHSPSIPLPPPSLMFFIHKLLNRI